MQNLKFSILINAPREKVWDTMLGDATYREWTKPFNPPGSYFEGDWSQGSKIKFIGVEVEGSKGDSGMYGEIAESRPHEFVSIRHLGELKEGVEAPFPESAEPAFENYTFTDKDGGTEVLVDLTNIPDEWVGMMNEMWPQALEKLKEISEK